MVKYRRLFEEKEKEYKDLGRRYSDLTKEYYMIVNAYGLEEHNGRNKPLGSVKSDRNIKIPPKKAKPMPKTNALDNLLHEMVCSESEMEETTLNKRGFSSKVANIESGRNTFQPKLLESSPKEHSVD